MTQKQSILAPQYRALTIGIVLGVTVVAFEGLAVTTIAPALAQELNGIDLYAWVFSAYLLAQLMGTVITGQLVDRRGPALSCIGALLIFGLGLVTAAIAPDMTVLIVGRALQGLGAGALINCIYSSIYLHYEDALRTQILAVFSSAYVIPALVGPYIAGVITERASWRYVFWGILPFLFLAGVLALPTFFRLVSKASSDQQDGLKQHSRIFPAIQLAIGTGVLLTGLRQLPEVVGIGLALGGLLLVVLPLRRLLPAGTLLARSGLPAIVASRGLFVAGYFGTETFIVLTLKTLKGYSADTAGLVVACAALSWSTAAALQATLDRRDRGRRRRQRVLIGIALMTVGIAIGLQVVWLPHLHLIVAIGGQIFSGFGIGLAHPTSSALAFSYATDRSEGSISADLQVADTFTPAVGIGIGGAAIAVSSILEQKAGTGVAVALVVQLLLVSLSLFAAYYRLLHAPQGLDAKEN